MVFLFFVLAACWNIKKVEEKELIQIDLITGFLGSGKTTFLKEYVGYLLSQGEKVGIIENDFGRRNIKVSTDDVISIVREYQQLVGVGKNYDEIRKILDRNNIFLVEEL